MLQYLRHNWLVYKIYNGLLEKAVRLYASGRLLDIGCATKPYKEMFEPFILEHIGLDHQGTIHDRQEIDIYGNATNIPQDDNSYDTIFCGAVLEHLEEPGKAISEMNRVLKQNGIVILTAPLFWHLHEEPRDFYRYTKYGLKYLFEKNGFEIVELKALSGFCVTFLQELVYYMQRYKRGNISTSLVMIIGCLIQTFAYILNKHDKSENFSCMYLVVARKIKNHEPETKSN